MEGNHDRTYLVLALLTFFAYATAIGFAWVEWDELQKQDVDNIQLFQ